MRSIGKGAYLIQQVVLDSKIHGLGPMSRVRYFVVGLRRSAMNGKFVKPRPLKSKERRPLSDYLNMDVKGTEFPNNEVRVRNLKLAYGKLGRKALVVPHFVDAFASPSRPYVKSGTLPCLTASRARAGGFWVTNLFRMTSLVEMKKFMHLEALADSDTMSSAKLGHAVGNSIDVSVLARLMQSILDCVEI